MQDQLSLGEYIRRLRKGSKRSLHSLAEATGISYSHLSRIENDSTLPSADTVARIATALNGDLKQMLEMANCLPRTILDRIVAREEVGEPASLRRTAGSSLGSLDWGDADGDLVDLARSFGLEEAEAKEMARTVRELLQLPPPRRSAVMGLVRSLYSEGDEGED